MTTLDAREIRWRISNTWDKGSAKWGMLVGYIDSRAAMDALDVLDAKWSTRMEPVSLDGAVGVRCTLTVNGVSREDVGVPSNTEPLKGAFSDALKRAAVHFGIGRELYELPKIGVECEVVNGKVRGPKATPEYKDGRWTIDKKVGWVRYEREPLDEDAANDTPGQGDGPSRKADAAHPADPVPAPALYPGVDQPASPVVMARKRYEWSGLFGWSAEQLDQAAADATNHGVGTMDNDTWRAFAAAVVKAGPTEQGTSENAAPEATVAEAIPPASAPASPSKKGRTTEEAIAAAEQKATAA